MEIDQPSDLETVVRRTFDADPARVFAMWTTPDRVRQWWPHPGGTMTTCDIDLRDGGSWRWILSHPEWGQDVAYSGDYRLVSAPGRLDFSERYEAMPGSEYEVSMTFVPTVGGTDVTTHMQYTSLEHRDGHMQAGFRAGLTGAYGRIDRLLP